MKKVLFAFGVLAGVLVVGAAVVIYSGTYNIAATAPHTRPVYWILSTMQENSIRSHAKDVEAPDLSDPSMAEVGFSHYHEMCVTCHGAPGIQPSAIGMGLYPAPPDLAESAEEFTEAELYWTVKNGIKMTGMPAYGPTHPDIILWNIVAFIEDLPDLSPEAYEQMVEKASLGESETTHEHGSDDH